MTDQLVTLILDEGKWPTFSMGVALASVAALLLAHRRSAIPMRDRVLASMNLYFGGMVGVLAFGHLLAVTVKHASGTLEGPVPLLYAIGVVLAIPSWWLVVHTRRILAPDDSHGRATIRLNAWLTITLLAVGIANTPLAVPGVLNIGYHLHSRRQVGWAIVGLAVVASVGLFVASVIFLASGQSFEEFGEV